MKPKLFTEIDPENPFTKLFTWESPERMWSPKTKQWYVSYSFFFVVIIGLLALVSEYVLIVAVVAFVFLWFIQGAIPPQIVEHTITTLGIRSFNKLFRWRNIKHFWFSEKENTKFLNLEVAEDENPNYVKRVSLIVNDGDDKEIFKILIQYLDYGEREEIGFNPLMRLIHGRHVEVSEYLPKSKEDEYIKYP